MRLNLVLCFGVASVCAILCGCSPSTPPPPAQSATKPKPNVSFHPQEMTDALHSVIAADRTVYLQEIVQRLRLKDPAGWSNALPVHAVLARQSAQRIQRKGAEFHFVLRSLDPLNPRNRPETEVESQGLDAVLRHPEKNFYAEEFLGGRRYFTAVYPELASSLLCLECHQRPPGAEPRGLGDVLGAIIVRVPLEF